MVKLVTCCGSGWPFSTGEGWPGPGGLKSGDTLRPWKWMFATGTPAFSSAVLMVSSRCCISAIAESMSATVAFDCALTLRLCGPIAKSAFGELMTAWPFAVMSAVSDAGAAYGAGAAEAVGSASEAASATTEHARTSTTARTDTRSARRGPTDGLLYYVGRTYVACAPARACV